MDTEVIIARTKNIPEDVVEFAHQWSKIDSNIREFSMRQMIFRLMRVKTITECKDLKTFYESEEYFKKLIEGLSANNSKISYNYNLIAALNKYFDTTFSDKKRPMWLQLPKMQEHLENVNNSKIETIEFLTKEFPKIYSVDLKEYCNNEYVAERDRMVCILGLFSAERKNELRKVLLSDFDFNTRTTIVRDTKNGNVFAKPIPEDKFWQCLAHYLDIRKKYVINNKYLFTSRNFGYDSFQPLSGSSITSIISNMSLFVWGRKINPHIFRYTRITNLSNYYDTHSLKEWTGHNSERSVISYVRKRHEDNSVMNIFRTKSALDLV